MGFNSGFKGLIWTIIVDGDTVIILWVKLFLAVKHENTTSEKTGKCYKRLENRKIGKGHTLKYDEKKKEGSLQDISLSAEED